MNRKKINKVLSVIMVSMFLEAFVPAGVNAFAAENVTSNQEIIYTDNSDFDKGNLNSVGYNIVGGQLQLSKEVGGSHVSSFYTLSDISIFGYEDNSQVTITDSKGNLIFDGIVNKGEMRNIKVNDKGTYRAKSDKKIAILTGDAVSSKVSGYYAMDQNGVGASKEVYTWVPKIYSNCYFCVFAMEDDTNVKITDVKTNKVIYSGTLNKGEHYVNERLSAQFLHIEADKLVSALTDYDQSYYVPSVNGNWSGNEFYTHVGNTGRWTHELTVFSYEDDNEVTITDSQTEELIWSGTLNYGDNHVIPYKNGTNSYLTVKSKKNVTVAVQPWYFKDTSYEQGTYVPDKEGVGIGSEFLCTKLRGGSLIALSYYDDTEIELYQRENGELRFYTSINLNKNESYDFSNEMYYGGAFLVKSSKNISLYSGYAEASAGFAPVQYGSLVTVKNGTWDLDSVSDEEDSVWQVSYNADIPEKTSLKVYLKTANTEEDLKNAQYFEVENGVINKELLGKYSNVRVDFSTEDENISPVLKDITIKPLKAKTTVELDKDVYNSLDDVKIKTNLYHPFDEKGKLNGKLQIIKNDSEGNEIEYYSKDLSCEYSEAGSQEDNGEFYTDRLEGGTYTAKVNWYDKEGNKVYAAEKNFVIDDNILDVSNSSEFKRVFDDYYNGDIFENKTVIIENDIDMAGITLGSYNDQPVKFAGTIEGRNNSISNLTIESNSTRCLTLIPYLTGTVQNISFENTICTGKYQVSGIVGMNNGLMENCTISGAITGTNCTGALAGINYGTMKYCTNNATVNGYSVIGGISGFNYGTIEGCTNNGKITASKYYDYITGVNMGTVK